MKCNTCNTDFTPLQYWEDANQAAGCAATVYVKDGQFYLVAHYGSRFDTQRYMLNGGNYEVGDICDNCINTLINEGNAVLIEVGVW